MELGGVVVVAGWQGRGVAWRRAVHRGAKAAVGW